MEKASEDAESVSIVAILSRYQQKASGMDLATKISVYFIRLIIAQRGDQNPELANKCAQLVKELTQCRMIANMLKVLQTVKTVISLKESPRPRLEVFFIGVSNCVRACEQIAGDMGVLQMHWCSHWDRHRISWHYKFYKSWALFFGAVAELLHTFFLSRHLAMCRRSAKAGDKEASEDVVKTRSELVNSVLHFFRNVGDMYIYFQWMERHNPNRTAVALFGMYSGILGAVCMLKGLRKP